MNDEETTMTAEAPPLKGAETTIECAAPDPMQEAEAALKDRAALERRVFDALFPMPADLSGGDLLSHAHRELSLAGMFDADSDYGGAAGHAVMRLMRVFAAEGPSGGSAYVIRSLFNLLADYRTLSPNDHSNRMDVSEMCGQPEGTVWQDTRDSRYFSHDGGKTWRNVEEKQAEQ